METWADFAEDLRRLADRAHSDLEEAAREKLSLTATWIRLLTHKYLLVLNNLALEI